MDGQMVGCARMREREDAGTRGREENRGREWGRVGIRASEAREFASEVLGFVLVCGVGVLFCSVSASGVCETELCWTWVWW